MLRINLLILILSISLYSFAQKEQVFSGTPIQKFNPENFEKELRTYKLFHLDDQALNSLVKKDQDSKFINLTFGESHEFKFHLFPHDIRTVDYQINVATTNGIESYPKSANKTYEGYFENGTGAIRLTIDEGFVYGFFETDENRIYIEPATTFDSALSQNSYVLYNEKDVIPVEGAKCAASELHQHIDKTQLPEPETLEKSVGECYVLEVAIASDFSIFDEFGSVAATENFTLGVLNNSQTNYNDDFDDEIQFQVITQFVSTCASCDPWPDNTNAVSLINSFGNWGNTGGFMATYDLGALWTNRNIFTPDSGDGVIGVAWPAALCSNNRYTVLENFSTNAGALRTLVSHELGHSFSAEHDAADNTIMAPFLNVTDLWSNLSLNDISMYIAAVAASLDCFSPCGVGMAPPVANFSANETSGCTPFTVNFQDFSTGTVDNYLWTFPGGNPSSSTDPNPTVIYNMEGQFDVSLQVSNTDGSDILTQSNFITVEASPVADFFFMTNGLTATFDNQSMNGIDYIWDFGDDNFSFEQNPSHTYAMDGMYNVALSVSNDCGTVSTSRIVTIVTPPTADFSTDITDGCIPFEITFNNLSSDNATSFLWEFEGGTPATSTDETPTVVYNGVGTFSVSLTATNAAGSNQKTETGYITVGDLPDASWTFTNTEGELLVNFENTSSNADSYSWDFGDSESSTETSPDHTYAMGGMYTVVLTATNSCGDDISTQFINLLLPPTADFSAENTNGCIPFDVEFTNLSSANATSWNWTFEGGTPASSTEQNPSVTYETPGTFDVTLVSSNAAGEATSTQTDYITVGELPTSGFTFTTNLGETVVDFTNTSTNATSYSWDFGNGESSTETSPSHNFLTDGVYTVVLTSTNECGSVTSSETITIITIPIANFSTENTSGCVPFTVTFNDMSSDNTTSWSWTFSGGDPATSTEQNPTVTYNFEGSFSVVLVATNEAGSNSITQNDFITIEGAPLANFSTDIIELNVNFNNLTTDATSYLWDFGDNTTSTDENPTYVYSEGGTYIVTLTAYNACDSTVFEKDVTVGTIPNAGFSSSATSGCTPLTVEFIDQSSTNTTSWDWVFEGGTPETSTLQNPTIVYNTPGTYAVTLTASNGQGSNMTTQESYITVGQGASVGFGADINDLSVTFVNTSTNATSYLWDFGDNTTSTVENPVHIYAEDGTYSVTLTVTNPCEEITITKEIIIITAPTANYTADATTGCVPFEVAFTDASSSNTDTWSWNFPGGSPTTSTEASPTVTYQNVGTYDVYLTVSNAAGEDTLNQLGLITVLPPPEADFDFEINGTEVNFTNLSINGSSYSWDFGNGVQSDAENPSIDFEQDGTYEVTLTTFNDCGERTITKTIVIATAPTASFSSSDTVGCVPLFSVQFFNGSSENTTSVKWTFEGGNPATSTEENPTVSYDTPGNYQVTLQALNAVGESTITEESYITVLNTPDAGFIPDVNGFDVNFFDNSIFATSYLWNFGDDASSTEINPTHTYAEEGTFPVTLIIENECGQDTAIGSVIIDSNLPFAEFSADTTDNCAPFEVQFTNESSENSTSFEWTFLGGVPATSTALNPLVVYSTPGVYPVTLIVSNATGTDALTKFEFITVTDIPSADFEFQSNDFTVSFSNLSTAGENFEWLFGDGESSTEENPTHTYTPDLSYEVQLLVSNACGSDTITQEIIFEGAAPVPAFESTDAKGCPGLEVSFTDLSEGMPSSWLWTLPGAEPAASTAQNPTATYNTPGIYPVTLEVMNPFGYSSQTLESYVEVIALAEADFSFSPTNLDVQFQNTSIGDNLSFEWDFGDMSQSDEENPTHTYPVPGMYTAQLVVTNDCGSDTSNQEINLIIDNIDHPEWLQNLALYPNPNNGNFYIEIAGLATKELDLALYNVLGQQFYKAQTQLLNGYLSKEIKLQTLASGIYFFEIKSGKDRIYKKLVIE